MVTPCLLRTAKLYFILLCIITTGFAWSFDTRALRNQEMAKQVIERLANDNELSPHQVVEHLQDIIKISESKNWEEAFAQASTVKLESLAAMNKYDEAEALLQSVAPLVENLNESELLIRVKLVELRLLQNNGNQTNLAFKFGELETLAISLENRRLAGSVYLVIGRTHSKMSNYKAGLVALKKAFEIADQLDDTVFLEVVLNEIGSANLRTQNYLESIEYYQRALKINEINNNTYHRIVTLYNLGKAYSLENMAYKSKDYFQQGLELCERTNDKNSALWFKRGLADLATAQQEWQSAINIYTEILPVFKKNQQHTSVLNMLNGLADSYIGNDQLDDAEATLEERDEILLKFPTPENRYHANRVSAHYLSARGDFEIAYTLMKKNNELLKEIHRLEKNQEVDRIRTQLESATIENYNRQLKKDNQLKQQLIERQRQQEKLWWVLIALCGLTVLFAFFAVYKQRLFERARAFIENQDHLTNANNRQSIYKKALQISESARLQRFEYAIALVDLDNMKKLNETYGQDTGDRAIVAFSKACEASFRSKDVFGRCSGVEWLIIIKNANNLKALTLFERLRQNLENQKVEGMPHPHHIRFSMGYVHCLPDSTESLNQLLKLADDKLSMAKEEGKNRVVD